MKQLKGAVLFQGVRTEDDVRMLCFRYDTLRQTALSISLEATDSSVAIISTGSNSSTQILSVGSVPSEAEAVIPWLRENLQSMADPLNELEPTVVPNTFAAELLEVLMKVDKSIKGGDGR